MPRTSFSATVAQAIGPGLALAMPVAVVGALRVFPPLGLDASSQTAWLGAIACATVALAAALGAIPALAAAVESGRWPAVATGAALTVLASSFAAVALGAPANVAALPTAGLGIGCAGAAGLMVVAANARERTVAPGRGRWLAALGGPLAAEAALAGALAATAQPEAATLAFPLLAGGAVIAVLVAGLWGAWNGPTWAAVCLAVGCGLLAWARPGSVEVVVAMGPLVAVPALLAMRPAVAAQAPKLPAEDPERAQLTRELRTAMSELVDARHTIALQRQELERATILDGLTGVASRRAIMERLRIEVAESRRYAHPVSAVLVDIDDMGTVNAVRGTSVGDAVLREVALRMRVRVREADAIGRVGGDAFLIVLPHTDEGGAAVFAEAIRERVVGRPIPTGGEDLSISVSIGVAIMRAGMDVTADGLVGRADEALASARAGGGNVIAFDRLHGLARLDDRRREGVTEQAG